MRIPRLPSLSETDRRRQHLPLAVPAASVPPVPSCAAGHQCLPTPRARTKPPPGRISSHTGGATTTATVGERTSLKGVTSEARTGELLAVLGSSGSVSGMDSIVARMFDSVLLLAEGS